MCRHQPTCASAYASDHDVRRAAAFPVWRRVKSAVDHVGALASGPIQLSGTETASWPLSPKPSAVRRARRLTRAQLDHWDVDGRGELAELLVGELVSKALRDTGETIRLTLWLMDGMLRCEVEDASPAIRHVHQAGGSDDTRGHAMDLVEQLACCWGHGRTATGTAVWFELPEPCSQASRTAHGGFAR
ncbi:ATP-binding protein, partial [Nonomuraea sp. RK-328]|nr:ATP-binding protein [Nonomuraea sp. RK-328]